MACTFNIVFNNGLTDKENIWLQRDTVEQVDINSYLINNQNHYKNKTCLHIGTGTSLIAIDNNKTFNRIDGLAVDPLEVNFANDLNIKNYKCYEINKYNIKELNTLSNYDLIIDNNIKSYTCCTEHYLDYFNWILNSVKPNNGEILTHTAGFYYIKPIDIEEINQIANKHGYTAFGEIGVVIIKPAGIRKL